MSIDVEELIHQVQQHPQLWDTADQDYKEKVKKGNAWCVVTKHLFPEYDSWSESQQKNQVQEVMVKWRTVRDNYIRSMRKQEETSRSGSGAKKVRTYIHANQLSFLRKSFEPRSTVSSVEATPSTSKDPAQPRPSGSKKTAPFINTPPSPTMSIDVDTEPELVMLPDEEGEETSPVPTSAAGKKKPRRKRGSATMDDELLKFMQTHQTRPSKIEEDHDVAFLYSLIPMIKKLTPQQNSQFRIHIVQKLDQMVYPPSNPPMPPAVVPPSQTSTSGSGYYSEYLAEPIHPVEPGYTNL